MMTWSPELLEYTRGRLLAREAAFGSRREEVSAALAACAGEERPLLAYYYATLPLTDVGDYSPAYFLSVARQALAVREEFPWCQALAEHRFLKDVAYPRVNTEELAPCRELFHDALAPRVRGLSLEEAILEVNRWCAEEATYRSTDGRTASPLQVYQRGFGRCGEESTFLVTALRSVGIAARQVYVPWWSHCDDNHAWVEAFDGQGWRYLGACEPEPQLDRGWFTHAAARAVMVHTRAFVQGSREEVAFLFPETDPVDWDIQEGVAVENITARYGDTKRLTVQVAGPDGAPAAGAWVSLSVLNMAAPREIARRQADSQGRVTLGLGKGSVLATAWEEASPGLLAECLLAPEDTQAALVLGQGLAAAGEWDFLPPADAGLTVPALSPSQEEARRACLDRAAALREEKRLAREEARPAPPTGEGARVWQSLTEKDREGELSPQLLEDALAAFAWEGQYPAKAFQEGLLSPRVALEVLTPWRRLLEGRFSPQEREAARQEPSRLWQWAQAAAPVDKDCYAALWGTPQGMLQVGASTSQGQQVLFCAACRALGIPAKLVDGVPQVWREDGFSPLWGQEPTAALTVTAPAGQEALEAQNYTLSRREAGGYLPLTTGAVPAGENRQLLLPPGAYRLWTVNRLPGGGLLARWEELSLAPSDAREVALAFREGDIQDMLERCPLPGFTLAGEDGALWEGKELLEKAPLSVLCFLEVNREPTEHLLGELREAAAALKQAGLPLYLALPSLSHRDDPTLRKALAALPWATVCQCDFSTVIPALGRRLYLDPDRLPLAILANQRGEGLYGCCGYNVGTAQLLLRLAAALKNLEQSAETCYNIE